MNAGVDLLHRTLDLLASKDVHCWVFGGWAEELHGLGAARAHRDVDLLCVADDFTRVDLLLREHPQLHEIHAKRFAHKRAFELADVCIELFLVQHDDDGYFTTFWGQRHDWPGDVLSSAAQLPVASIAALRNYRTHWRARFNVSHSAKLSGPSPGDECFGSGSGSKTTRLPSMTRRVGVRAVVVRVA